MLNLKTPISKYTTFLNAIRLPTTIAEQDVEIFMNALGELEHAREINRIRNRDSAQAVDLLLALLTGQANYANQVLCGYGWRVLDSKVSAKNKAPRTDATRKCGMNSNEDIKTKIKELEIADNDTLETALNKIEKYASSDGFLFLNKELLLVIEQFKKIYAN